MATTRVLKFDDYVAIFRRRMAVLLTCAVAFPVIGYGISRLVPARYQSQSLVFVEQQQVPDAFVKPVITEDLLVHLAGIEEQTLTRSRLEPLIDKFGLYREDAGKVAKEDLVDRMRSDISIDPVKSSGSPNRPSLPAFYISFTADTPVTAQRVCSEVTSMFIEQNLREREKRAAGTTDFLSKQLEDAKRELNDQDSALAQFKSQHLGQLPGQETTNLSVLAAYNTRLQTVTQEISHLQEQRTYLDSMLSQQLAAWNASKEAGTESASPQTLEQQLSAAQMELSKMEVRYTPDHPDVVKARADVASIKRKLDAANNAPPKPAAAKPTVIEPPEIQKLRAQIHEGDASLTDKQAERKTLEAAIAQFQRRLQLSPIVEEQYKTLTRDYQTALAFYNDLLAKRTQASMATDMERREQGQQFKVMEPANRPLKPVTPNRPMFVLVGEFLGLTVGLLLVVRLELRHQVVRTADDVQQLLHLAALASMPIVSAKPNGKVWLQRKPKPDPATWANRA